MACYSKENFCSYCQVGREINGFYNILNKMPKSKDYATPELYELV